jgi:chromosome segregation ATPase
VSKRLANAVEELRAEELRIQGEADELRSQAKSCETQLKQIRAALAVLGDKPQRKAGKQKPAASKQEVLETMFDILKTNGPVQEAELKDLVADRLASLGKSRIGLALRFSEALADGKFVRGSDGTVSVQTKSVPK